MSNFRLTADLALPAAIHRIKMLEEKIEAMEGTIAHLSVKMTQATASMMDYQMKANEIEKLKIMVPQELRPTNGKFRARGNRSYPVVSQRWKIWKEQWEAGMTPLQIASAWGCDHSTIRHAIRKKFIASKCDPRKHQRTNLETGKFIK